MASVDSKAEEATQASRLPVPCLRAGRMPDAECQMPDAKRALQRVGKSVPQSGTSVDFCNPQKMQV